MIGAPCQSSSSLTRTRTVSSRQIRQRGSLRSKSVLRGSAALVIVLIRKSSIRATSTSDTEMAFPPRSRRTRAVVDGFHSFRTRPVARQGINVKCRSMPTQVRSTLDSNPGTSAVLSCTWSPTAASVRTTAKHFRVINGLDCTPTIQTTMLRDIALCGYRHHWFSMEN